MALLFTVALFNRPLEPVLLRLVPGWETGRALAVMVVGMLALGQSLDSLTMLAGLGDKGTLAAMRGALADAVGPELFLAVVGTVGGAGPNAALLVTSGCVFVGSVVWLRRCRTW